ncbi:hypothetical protein HS7_06300 [Sulfolobales archaeon HS-7]|nr:hypothetical protein HS7_06300 [Sulfolobales archaeon HS-7]
MARVVDIAHFDKDGNLTSLKIDDIEPMAGEKGFAQEGGFFVTVKGKEGRAVIKISDKEAIDMANRIIEAYREHVKNFIELSKRRQPLTQERRRKDEDEEIMDELDEEDFGSK